jgi:predicted transport protein
MTWICSTCGRQFRNTNQDHSCLITDLESHFVNKQQNVIDTFEKIKNEVMQLEGVQINSVKNAILFQTKSNFLAVKPKKTHLDIEFVLDEKVDEFPIYKTFQATKSKYAHFVRLESPEEVDEQLILWLRKAYKISSE